MKMNARMMGMKRATLTLPDDLAQAVDEYVQAQEAPPALTTVMQTALREYLRERGFLRTRRPLKISPKGNSGRSDVSENHDLYLTGMKK
jgi:metal-responsive CopG/Arc/MetJ family transcriptional regulator